MGFKSCVVDEHDTAILLHVCKVRRTRQHQLSSNMLVIFSSQHHYTIIRTTCAFEMQLRSRILAVASADLQSREVPDKKI